MSMNAAERMNLMRFVCSFVWTDLKVAQVSAWLRTPPNVEDIDPTSIPRAHRQLFLQAAELAVKVDGRVVPAEAESLALFRELLSD